MEDNIRIDESASSETEDEETEDDETEDDYRKKEHEPVAKENEDCNDLQKKFLCILTTNFQKYLEEDGLVSIFDKLYTVTIPFQSQISGKDLAIKEFIYNIFKTYNIEIFLDAEILENINNEIYNNNKKISKLIATDKEEYELESSDLESLKETNLDKINAGPPLGLK